MVTRLTILLCLASLPACVGSHADKQSNTFGDPTRIAVPSAPASPPRDTRAEVVAPPLAISHEEFSSSQNAMQQSFTGVGAQLGKLADRVDASLVRIEAGINTTLTAVANLKVDFEAKLEVQNKAVIELQAKVDTVAQAQAVGEVAVGSKLDTVQQNTSAGRDSIQNQFTREMRDTFMALFHETIAIVAILGLVMVLLQHRHNNSALKIMGGPQCEPQSFRQRYRSSQ